MALDFELNLIMPNESAAIFCRSNIEATRYLIKQKAPRLAIKLSQTLTREPLPLNEEEIHSVYQQSFYVNLDPDEAWELVDTLAVIIQDEPNSPTPGLVMLAKSLHKEWVEMAQMKGLVDK
jgi:hypothetical protein